MYPVLGVGNFNDIFLSILPLSLKDPLISYESMNWRLLLSMFLGIEPLDCKSNLEFEPTSPL